MFFDQVWCLSEGRCIDNDLVLINHPKIIFVSSIGPSASNFFMEVCEYIAPIYSVCRCRNKGLIIK